ncbi:MAG: VWA domain-containing protein [Anaerolineae bacterium]|nr:VWA domain-containing protein [Anaerolineae bacterium]
MITKKFRIFLFLLAVLLPLVTVSALSARETLSRDVPQSAAAADSTETASFNSLVCPPLGGFGSSLESPNFCVYFNDPPTSVADATTVQTHTDDYWDQYSIGYGFPAPLFIDPLEVQISGNAGCNGSAWDNYIIVYDGCFDAANPENMQFVVGHEIFHRVQFASDPDWDTTWTNSAWLYEGTARNMEDVAFANVDTWANCLAAPFSYCDEVNGYLASTNADITSFGMRYQANLFWTYFREQFGDTVAEPGLGVDALVTLWQQMCCAESVAAVNNALAIEEPGMTFDEAFRHFTVANYTHNLTGLPDASYNYADEDQVGNPSPYGPLAPTNGGTIDSGTSANWNAQAVTRYGARYYSATPDATDCEVITASFTRTAGSTEFYHVVTQIGSAFETHVTGTGASWTQSFLNNGITQITAVIGGRSNGATVDVDLSCATPVINIELPNQLAPAYVGPFGSPDDIIVQVSVTDGSPTGPIVGGLNNSDFRAEVGGVLAVVLNGGFVQEEYFLLVNTPNQAANGPYDLEISLEAPGTSTIIATDLEDEAVVYDATNTDHIIVTDVSGSMGWDGKMQAAQDAANLFIDASNSTDGLGLASYNHDIVDTLDVEFGALPHRNDAHAQVNAYVAGGATSIGDGLDEAVSLLAASPTGNARCQFTLLSDGMENSSLFWADVEAAVVGTGCPVMTVAFGPSSNELLMEDIADATGGVAYYNDVYVSGLAGLGGTPDETEMELSDTYLHALCEGQGCERLFTEEGIANYNEIITHTMHVDASVSDLVTVLNWWPGFQGPGLVEGGTYFNLWMVSPDGTTYQPADYEFEDGNSGHVGYRVDDPEAGDWLLVVIYTQDFQNKPYQVLGYGQTDTAVNLILPSADSTTGEYVPLYAMWQPGGQISATVTAPDGTTTLLPLLDDGQHGDGTADDGFYAGLYTLVNYTLEATPGAEPAPDPPAADEGAYQVHLLATDGDIQRETQGAFAVLAGDDSDGDSIPDIFIETHCPGAPNSDNDLDNLSCADEYFTGTDPNNSDTDGGGESDHSEAILHPSLDQLNPADDLIEALDFVQTTAQNGSVLLAYDVKAEYQQMQGYRATSPTGPWQYIGELSLTGEHEDATTTNGTTYYYCLQARDALDSSAHWSAVVCSDEVTPRTDPINPEAAMLINGGAASTNDLNVLLSFVPVDEEHEGSAAARGGESAFDDIMEVMISNDPNMTGANWQPFAQDIPWQLEGGCSLQTVYARFRDDNGNESVSTETASIYVDSGGCIYLPIIVKP